MKLLLDTHVWLWMLAEPERLSPAGRRLVEGMEHELFFSAASAWEITIKHGLGKLTLPGTPADVVPERMRRTGVTPLAVLHRHALQVASLPPLHHDPFDRLLIAQAQLEELTILTADRAFRRYDVRVKAA
ncbi:MAG: type II toxin-antitoxin system VapC family toxin [Gemmatimonadales bacterium]|nr:type II toxin-antitoxin system VapC family toxin [Gemmatimonadales bacterium]